MKLYYLIAILFLLTSCVKDKPQEPATSNVSINANSKVLIVNEGNYGWNNASVSVYDASSGAIADDYYKQQNNNQNLGDVCQSITKYNNHYYLVVNNSNKIIVTDASSFTKTATINGFNSPRYLLPVTYNKAYVSDLFANSVQVVDLNTNTITGSIPCHGWTNEMALIYNKAFVTNLESNYCYVINTMTDAIIDSVNIGKGGSSIVIDKNSKVWILTSGNTTSAQNGKLVKINPVTMQIEATQNFTTSDHPQELCINKTRDTLYYLNKGICQFPITSVQLPSTPLVNAGSKVYYGLDVNPKDYSIYVSDAIDYVQKSKIEVYDATGNLKTSFTAGIISNGFIFE